MKSIKLTSFVLLFSMFFSCTKFEEGPLFSFRTKRNRVKGVWELVKYEQNGNDLTGSFYPNGLKLEFTKMDPISLEGEIIIDESLDASFPPQADMGYPVTWGLPGDTDSDGVKEIIMDFYFTSRITGDRGHEKYNILRLTNKEMKLLEPDQNPEFTFFFEKVK